MPHYRRVGDVPAKRHTQQRQADGTLLAEELIGREGFSQDSALLYHQRPPTDLRGADPVDQPAADDAQPNYPLQPRLLASAAAVSASDDVVWGRRTMFANADVRIGVGPVASPSPLYRNADGDELLFVLRGAARFESVYGTLDAQSGDYVVVPKGTIHRWVPIGVDQTLMLTVETAGRIQPPQRYLSNTGQFLETAPYCERDIVAPTSPLLVANDGPTAVVTKRDGKFTKHTLGAHPFDVVGWDGCLYPYKINIYDFEPITGRIHQPPPVHQMFEAPGVVVCSFVPRKIDYHPLSIPAPYNHANVDSDEVLVYFEGDFLSRKGVTLENGSMTLHPAGITHGPQPGSVEASLGAEATNETAVMIDTFAPLNITNQAIDLSDSSYTQSWTPGANT